MRDKDTLKAFKDVTTLQQYLFLNPCNHIMVETELSGRLALTMDDNADVWATPQVVGVSTFKYNSMLSCPVWMDILEQVKEQPPETFFCQFKTRWEEIQFLVAVGNTLNSKAG